MFLSTGYFLFICYWYDVYWLVCKMSGCDSSWADKLLHWMHNIHWWCVTADYSCRCLPYIASVCAWLAANPAPLTTYAPSSERMPTSTSPRWCVLSIYCDEVSASWRVYRSQQQLVLESFKRMTLIKCLLHHQSFPMLIVDSLVTAIVIWCNFVVF